MIFPKKALDRVTRRIAHDARPRRQATKGTGHLQKAFSALVKVEGMRKRRALVQVRCFLLQFPLEDPAT